MMSWWTHWVESFIKGPKPRSYGNWQAAILCPQWGTNTSPLVLLIHPATPPAFQCLLVQVSVAFAYHHTSNAAQRGQQKACWTVVSRTLSKGLFEVVQCSLFNTCETHWWKCLTWMKGANERKGVGICCAHAGISPLCTRTSVNEYPAGVLSLRSIIFGNSIRCECKLHIHAPDSI